MDFHHLDSVLSWRSCGSDLTNQWKKELDEKCFELSDRIAAAFMAGSSIFV